MLIAFFTIAEPDTAPPNDRWLAHAVTTIAKDAWDTTFKDLSRRPPYDVDGGHPFGLVYTTEFTNAGGLSSAQEICEQWAPGHGILVGLVIEGKASGPLYGGPGLIGVRPEDIDRTITDTFARHLATWLRETLPGYVLEPSFHMSDWALYERQSDLMTWAL